nr:Niemann-Pick C2 protein [Lasioderma serricorne]
MDYRNRFSLVLVIFLAVFGGIEGHSDCGSTVGKIISLEIAGCDNNAPKCILKRGTNESIEVSFEINEDTDAITAVVHGVILGVEVPFHLPNPDACVDSGITCPVKTGNTYTYKTTLPVLQKYPKVSLEVKWELQDKDGKDIVCGLIPVKIE